MVSVNLFKGAFNEFIILRCVIIKKKYVKFGLSVQQEAVDINRTYDVLANYTLRSN